MTNEASFRAIVGTKSVNTGINTSGEIAGYVTTYGSGVTLTRVRDGEVIAAGTAEVRDGEYSFYFKATLADSGIKWPLDGPLTATATNVSVWLKPLGAVTVPSFKIGLGTSSPSASVVAVMDEEDGNGWQRFTAAFTSAQASAATNAFIYLPNPPSANIEVWIECFQAEDGTGPTTYFHGDFGDGHKFVAGPAHEVKSERMRFFKGSLVPGGTVYDLDNCDTIRCEAALGIGVYPVTPLTEERASAPGTMYFGSKIGEREIQLKFLFKADTLVALHALRAYMTNIFPPNHTIRLQYTRAGVTQEIDCVYKDGLEFGEVFGKANQRATLTLLCPDPHFREVGQSSVLLTVATGDNFVKPYHATKQDGVWTAYSTGPRAAGRTCYVGSNKAFYIGTSSDGTYAWVQYWSGSAWTDLGRFSGTTPDIRVIKFHPNGKYLIVGGKFTGVAWGASFASSLSVNNVAYYNYNTGAWLALGSGVNDYVEDFDTTDDGTLSYFTGNFSASGATTLNCAGKFAWASSAWSACYSGLSGTGRAVAIGPDGKVAFGGDFSAAGALASAVSGLTVSAISGVYTTLARQYWVTAVDRQGRETMRSSMVSVSPHTTGGARLNWTATFGAASYNIYVSFSNGEQGRIASGVTATTFDHTNQYFASGDQNRTTPAENTAIGTGPGKIWTFPGGQWTYTETTGTPYIALYDPTAGDWETLGSQGFNGAVHCIIVPRDRIGYIVGGAFTLADGRTANRVARLVGSLFRPLGLGVNNTVYDMKLMSDGSLVVVGTFTTAGGRTTLAPVARWVGREVGVWLPVGIKITSQTVYGVAARYDDIHIAYTGSSAAASTLNRISFRGSANSLPRIYITGPGKPWIENYTTGKAIYLDLTLSDYEVLEIDLRTGYKTVRSSVTGNILYYVVPGSDMSFYLVPGPNDIVTHIEGATPSTVVRFVDRPTYLSADLT